MMICLPLLMLRANADLPHMGLSTWKESPNGKIRQADVLTAKNYLSSEELTTMNSLVNQFLEYAEQQARSRKVMTMHDWEVKLEAILRLNDMSILANAGRVSMERAKSKASREFEVFEARELERENTEDEDELEEVLNTLLNLPKSDSSEDHECK
ncbi:Virulence protein-like protein [Methanocorpusculum labreanum Z]|uniref:Virulence protein-like protein n=2 Tax=Methanocorpusculum labreanum TaxID=83984 RepID=A2STV6_METLZ|nr:Virulence protein-like protein [Methanocorpusculum labreanum Z]